MNGYIRTGLLAALIALIGGWPASARSGESSAAITYLRKGVAKPPGLHFYATLGLHNTRSKPLWFLLPYDLDRPLAEDGMFRVQDWMDKPFVGDVLYGRGETSSARHTASGSSAASLVTTWHRALTLTVTDELFFASRGTKHRTIQVWEAEALLVDGMTPFEKWVSFNLRSDPDLLVPSQSEMGQELAEFKRVNDLNYYNHPKKWPEQKVKFMKGDRIVKHQVPVKDVPD